ncbi:MAG: 50S ribosomal protein L32 [Candidatus Omnitrophica bacterium]|nr:50S ribosomal protein L32 [Candidatus Omnitrophota bacterium]
MPNPKRRHSNQRTRTRRAHDFLKLKSISKCTNCGAAIMPHRICSHCGFYGGKQVMTIKVKSKSDQKES